ncbi:MAG: LysM domain-containing protein [bacterium]|nr:LysM domain-containing protein [bacterium]
MTKILLLLACLLFNGLALAERIGNLKTYIVEPGDTLREIKFNLQIHGVNIKKLNEWNPDLGAQVQLGQSINYYVLDKNQFKGITKKNIEEAIKKAYAKNSFVPVPQPRLTRPRPHLTGPELPQDSNDIGSRPAQPPNLFKLKYAFPAIIVTFLILLYQRRKNTEIKDIITTSKDSRPEQTVPLKEKPALVIQMNKDRPNKEFEPIVDPSKEQLVNDGVFPRKIILRINKEQETYDVACMVDISDSGNVVCYGFPDNPEQKIAFKNARKRALSSLEVLSDRNIERSGVLGLS